VAKSIAKNNRRKSEKYQSAKKKRSPACFPRIAARISPRSIIAQRGWRSVFSSLDALLPCACAVIFASHRALSLLAHSAASCLASPRNATRHRTLRTAALRARRSASLRLLSCARRWFSAHARHKHRIMNGHQQQHENIMKAEKAVAAGNRSGGGQKRRFSEK